ncbi:hypothetical protein IST455A_04270 [Burkholderia multivorans]|nr:hypothetical protein IST495B_04128 [Burkholderia multivorans]CAB5292974.1 hypothetical protein IST4119_04023 [Burkholderia multivorans]CAB5307010.1 hypothetical protein IST419_04303 [Burkholderia multivorans]CAB5324614.1 hypothetical protein IST424_04136 [Burkholderia multivorans]CAB5330439.1 hypothetical protein IST453_04139 [Burkholderia multivorans]
MLECRWGLDRDQVSKGRSWDGMRGGHRVRLHWVARRYAGFERPRGTWLAVALEVRACRLEVAERRLGRGEVQLHQPAGRVVDVHQQRALRRPILEPRMLAAVDLDQLAQARASRPRLVDLRRTLPPWHPQASVGHQPPHRLLGQPNAMTFPELVAGQRRPEVGIAFADDRECPVGRHGVQSVIAGLRAPLRHETLRPVLPQSANQSPNLPRRQSESLGRAPRLELAVRHVLNNLESVQFSHRHRDPFCRSHRSSRRRTTGGRIAYAARKRTLQLSRYNRLV